MRTSHLLATLSIASLGFSSFTYAVSLPPPAGATSTNTGGIFMSYFQNLANNDCTSSQIVQGFLNGSTESTFLKPDCKSIGLALGSFFQSITTNGAISGFDIAGNPTYYDYSNLTPTQISNLNNQLFNSSTNLSAINISNITNNLFGGSSVTTFTGALTQYVTTLSTQSQWKDVTGGIAYTGGIVRIGVSPLSTTLAYNSTTRFGTEINPGFGGVYLGWNGGTQGTHIGNGLNLTGVPGYGDLFARNIQAYGNLYVSGTTNLGGNLTINTGSQICLAGSCINNFSSVGGSKWTDIAGGAIQRNSNVTVTGNITANGFLYSSDKNLKKNITPLEGSLEKIMKLSGYSYNWKSSGKADIGIIAQEVETVYPELVHTNAEGVKSVEYANLIAPLIEAVKTQQKEIESLKAEVKALKK